MAWEDQHPEEMRRYKREHYYRNRGHYLQEIQNRRAQRLKERIAADVLFQTYLAEHPTKICSQCEQTKPTAEFNIRVSGGHCCLCYECIICQKKHVANPTGPHQKEKESQRRKINRRDPQLRAKHIVLDSKASDRRHNRTCDIDIPFVEHLITNGCFYCGNTDGQMTLDRIDNEVGHMRTNVNPACYRCNKMRGNMPYEAWTALIPSIRMVAQKGLFGSWNLQHWIYTMVP